MFSRNFAEFGTGHILMEFRPPYCVYKWFHHEIHDCYSGFDGRNTENIELSLSKILSVYLVDRQLQFPATNTAYLVGFRGDRKLITICGIFAANWPAEFGQICRGKLWSLIFSLYLIITWCACVYILNTDTCLCICEPDLFTTYFWLICSLLILQKATAIKGMGKAPSFCCKLFSILLFCCFPTLCKCFDSSVHLPSSRTDVLEISKNVFWKALFSKNSTLINYTCVHINLRKLTCDLIDNRWCV